MGGRARKGPGRKVVRAGLAVWDRILFRHVLVADVRADHIRAIPACTGVLSVILCNRDRGRFSGSFCRHFIYAIKAIREHCIIVRTFYMGVHGVFAVLADGE
jgi:hypothetical protein